ncbi:MAG: Coenzyme F420 hydrogenase/dehydrogenase, beta subunit C-terminal domain [Proteobacteria bacterium]|nr:Coenzyme F420 hydrogenase/dehydrogenase, beta subunit C-terminal domain [Pseudomonadota bacterium]
MKTFSNLIQEVQNTGQCNQCGGCVSFCSSVNYGALGIDENGRPAYIDQDKCIECGICYMICPSRDMFEHETRHLVGWSAPMGRVLDISVACAHDKDVRTRGSDGGVVTALLLHLLDTGRIDGAIVTRRIGLFQQQPHLARTHQEIWEAAGSYLDASSGMSLLGNRYSTFSPSIQAFKPLTREGLRRIAFVGVPCQIKALRKMQVLKLKPSETVHIALGLFCGGNFDFGEKERNRLEKIGGFSWDSVADINLRDVLQVSLKDGSTLRIPVDELQFMLRPACKYCQDYTAEYADLSFGGAGAPEKWTTVFVRTPVGRAAFSDAKGIALREFRIEDNPQFAGETFAQVQAHSTIKKQQSAEMRSHSDKVIRLF